MKHYCIGCLIINLSRKRHNQTCLFHDQKAFYRFHLFNKHTHTHYVLLHIMFCYNKEWMCSSFKSCRNASMSLSSDGRSWFLCLDWLYIERTTGPSSWVLYLSRVSDRWFFPRSTWRCQGLNPGLSVCNAGALPLSYVHCGYNMLLNEMDTHVHTLNIRAALLDQNRGPCSPSSHSRQLDAT